MSRAEDGVSDATGEERGSDTLSGSCSSGSEKCGDGVGSRGEMGSRTGKLGLGSRSSLDVSLFGAL
jgi:hypothetical protein